MLQVVSAVEAVPAAALLPEAVTLRQCRILLPAGDLQGLWVVLPEEPQVLPHHCWNRKNLEAVLPG